MPLVPFRQLAMGLANGAENLGRGLVHKADQLNMSLGHALDNYMNPVPPHVDPYAHYPAYMRGQQDASLNNQIYLGHYDPRTLPQNLPDIAAYRADPTGRYGGKDGLETQATNFLPRMIAAGWTATRPGGPMVTAGGSPAKLYAYARELGRAQHYGVSQLTATQLAALALKEGRDDYGHNSYDTNNARSTALVQRLAGGEDAWGRKVLDNDQSLEGMKFAATVAEKQELAKRLNIPFAQAWNGVGHVTYKGRTVADGAQYAKSYDYALKAAQHPKNKQLVDFIQSALDAGARDR
jgi:hypothetical protein